MATGPSSPCWPSGETGRRTIPTASTGARAATSPAGPACPSSRTSTAAAGASRRRPSARRRRGRWSGRVKTRIHGEKLPHTTGGGCACPSDAAEPPTAGCQAWRRRPGVSRGARATASSAGRRSRRCGSWPTGRTTMTASNWVFSLVGVLLEGPSDGNLLTGDAREQARAATAPEVSKNGAVARHQPAPTADTIRTARQGLADYVVKHPDAIAANTPKSGSHGSGSSGSGSKSSSSAKKKDGVTATAEAMPLPSAMTYYGAFQGGPAGSAGGERMDTRSSGALASADGAGSPGRSESALQSASPGERIGGEGARTSPSRSSSKSSSSGSSSRSHGRVNLAADRSHLGLRRAAGDDLDLHHLAVLELVAGGAHQLDLARAQPESSRSSGSAGRRCRRSRRWCGPRPAAGP